MSIVVSSLAECEAVIERGLRSFVEVGEALLRIRDERLYREGFETFESYCTDRWDLGRKRAYDFIASAEVVAELSPIGDTRPANESVARELAPLREDPEQLREAWTEVVQAHGPKPTAAQVREVVAEHREPKPEKPVDYCPTCGHRIVAGRPLPQRK